MTNLSLAHNQTIMQAVEAAESYYDGTADDIYRSIWGNSIHLGLFERKDEALPSAMQRAKDTMIDGIALHKESKVLEVGCGYGTLARQLVRNFDCSILATNISQKQLDRAAELTEAEGLSDKVRFEKCDFHHLPYEDDSFEVYWSQESFLHGGDRVQVLNEAHRVLEPFGLLAFSEITLRRSTPPALREQILKRVKSPSMWSKHDYEVQLKACGFQVEKWEDWSENVARTYGWTMKQLERKQDVIIPRIGQDAYDHAYDGMKLWKQAAEDGYLGWIHVIAAATQAD
ncbi:methyltransferase domain-containing protein [Terasakiella sp. A23]|uniref:methyltransferase domain-containing protein n=1 Tax=Terasakiella sp. FCG-A23 TaxID=3080561 RepID=UPI002953AB41|nr:methyltransferase domain-containing protein [Terasakiella sp. A23]MDV7340136.1 methyltransferase domain-containing protein [Terasakiella sp. A23]